MQENILFFIKYKEKGPEKWALILINKYQLFVVESSLFH